MIPLIVCLTDDSGTWGHARRVIEDGEWGEVYAITDGKAKDFSAARKIDLITVDTGRLLPDLAAEMHSKLRGKVKDFEVAVNFISGSGKEHMAMMSAVLKLGVGVRLVVLTKEGVREL
jgi:hypothetical protein